jgi:hopanoid biosynthesis associated radical SAM protein HpnJ
VRTAERLKTVNPRLQIGFVGAHVAVSPHASLKASPAIDFVAREEFDYTIQDVAAGRPLAEVAGLSYRDGDRIEHNPPRPAIEDMDALPFVMDVYRRDLVVEDYFNGYLLHPYVSLYTGRGCRSRCTFCLWPQTIGGHRYRTRSPGNVAREIALGRDYFPTVREFFFDDDTFTDDLPRAAEIARRLGALGVTWSCNAKPNVPLESLRILKDNGLRVLLVGYETGSQQILNNIRKGTRVDVARRFTEDCHRVGIRIHGTFIVGLPGETPETLESTIRFAREINPHTIQVSLATPYPGTELYRQAVENGWLTGNPELVSGAGIQQSTLRYPDLSPQEIFSAVERFYRRFYFRPRKVAEMLTEMLTSRRMLVRRLREGAEFFRFLAHREPAQ